jgi:hypothetical protein
LGAALLIANGVVAWMRGWRACQPAPVAPVAPVRAAAEAPTELVSVLAAMALACADG